MLLIMYGLRDDATLERIAMERQAKEANFHILEAKFGILAKMMALDALQRALAQGANVVLHGAFSTNKEVALFVKLARLHAAKIEFMRLDTAQGELLSFEECFAS